MAPFGRAGRQRNLTGLAAEWQRKSAAHPRFAEMSIICFSKLSFYHIWDAPVAAQEAADRGGAPGPLHNRAPVWYRVTVLAAGFCLATAALVDGGSSNGRTADSDSASLGSNPSPPAKSFNQLQSCRLSQIFSGDHGGITRRHIQAWRRGVPDRARPSCGFWPAAARSAHGRRISGPDRAESCSRAG